MNKKKAIPIFFSADNAYIPFLSVTIKSLVENSSEENQYEIKILNTNVDEDNKKIIKKNEKKNINIEFVDVSKHVDKIKDKLYTRDYYSNTTYYRLFIPELYPEYDKALYLDSDTLVLDDIANLYNTDIGNNLLGAVPDGIIQKIREFQEYAEKVVGVASYKNYFNAGVLLMNLDELRKFGFQEKFIYLLSTIKFSVAQDQDYLNRICKGRVKLIEGAWNLMPVTVNVREDNIKLIHYNFTNKPWHAHKIPYEEYFWKYAKKTEFIKEIEKTRDNYTEEQRLRDLETNKKLTELAKKESDCVGDDRK